MNRVPNAIIRSSRNLIQKNVLCLETSNQYTNIGIIVFLMHGIDGSIIFRPCRKDMMDLIQTKLLRRWKTTS